METNNQASQHYKKSKVLVIGFVFFIFFASCTTNEEVFTSNKQLLTEVDKYISYVNKLPQNIYDPEKAFILISVKKSKLDTINVILNFSDYIVNIIEPDDSIIGFYNYNCNHILVTGDYPNSLIEINRKFNKDTQLEILNKYFYDEYQRYLEDPILVIPKLLHYTTVYLEFNTHGEIVKAKKRFD